MAVLRAPTGSPFPSWNLSSNKSGRPWWSVPFDQTRHALQSTLCSPGLEEIAMRCVSCSRQHDASERSPASGLPQGSPLSPVIANAVIHPLDHIMEQASSLYLRYADNLLILAPGEAQARDARQLASDTLAGLGLRLNVGKSAVARLSEITFLGFCFHPAGGGGYELEVSPEALDSCLRHLHLLRSTGANREELQRFLAQWLGYFGKAASSDTLQTFLRKISREFMIGTDRSASSRRKRQMGYDGTPRPLTLHPRMPTPAVRTSGCPSCG